MMVPSTLRGGLPRGSGAPKTQRPTPSEPRRRTPMGAIARLGVLSSVFCLLAVPAFSADAPGLDADRFHAHVKALTAAPHRLAGTPEGRAAGDYIEAQLRAMPGQVFVQRFRFPQEKSEVCELRAAVGTIPLQPLRANGLQPSVTDADGFRGEIIRLGPDGRPERPPERLPDRWIAVADVTTREGMVHAFRYGAGAVLFVGRPDHERRDFENKVTSVSADLPRFYLSAADAERFGLAAVREGVLVARGRWENLEGRNLYLWIKGTAPVFKHEREECVILSAHYDTRGVTPTNTPDEEGAANCAALIETARLLAESPPRRSVLIAFFDNHANFLEGGREFYMAFRRGISSGVEDPWPVRLKFIEDERAYIGKVLDFLGRDDLLQAQAPVRDKVLQTLRLESKYRYDDHLERLTNLRLEVHARREAGGDVAVLEAEVAAAKEEKLRWQRVRESVRDRVLAQGAEEGFKRLTNDIAESLRNRLAELDEIEAQAREGAALGSLLKDVSPVAHAAYRFTAGNDRWLIWPHGYTRKRFFSDLFDAVSAALSPAEREALRFAWGSRPTWENGIEENWRLDLDSTGAFSGWLTCEESAIGGVFEIPGLILATEQDHAPLAYVPDRRLPAAQLDRIRTQAEAFRPFLRAMGNSPAASIPYWVLRNKRLIMESYQWAGDHAEGHAVKSLAFGETQANKVEPNVPVHLVAHGEQEKQPFGLREEYYAWADANGIFPYTPVLMIDPVMNHWRKAVIESARFDADGRIAALTALRPDGGAGSVQAGWLKASHFRPKALSGHYCILNMFKGESGRVLGRNLPFRGEVSPIHFKLLNGLSNAEYPRLHFRFDPRRGIGTYLVYNPMGVKFIYRDPLEPDNVALYINASRDALTGVGYGPGAEEKPEGRPHTLDLRRASARDLYLINESRLDTLRSKNIILNALEILHSRARGMIERLDEAGSAAARGWADLSGRVLAFERRIYRPVIAVTDDMVVAAMLLLLMAVPFSFSLQSLVLATHDIYRKILRFVIIFIATYALLYHVHPAFSFSATPSIIILAFVIMVMSGLVIYLLYTKFNYEIKKLQGLATAAHTFHQSLFGNVGAAVALAISTMRRRPVRTGLTVATVVMLTFTIVSFVSFRSERDVNEFYKGPGDATPRILIRHQVWSSLPEALLEDVRGLLGPEFQARGRYWRVRELTVDEKLDDLQIPIRHANGRLAVASSLMTYDPVEVRRLPALRAALPDGERAAADLEAAEGVFLSASLAEKLGAKPGDRLRLCGGEYAFLGAFDSRALLAIRQVDESPLLPVNFKMTRMAMGSFEFKGSAQGGSAAAAGDLQQLLSEMEPEAMEPVSPEYLILAPSALSERLGAALKAIVIYAEKDADLEKTARDLAVAVNAPVFLNAGGERRMFLYGDKYGVAGVADVVVPLLLGALIIFSTMLGSIIDREKEIYTFSALGLPPKSIAMLFFFEAGIYAVLGGFGGYLLSQVCTRVLEKLAEYGIFRAPEMNYSSSAAVNTILLVMATVVFSTIWPAVQAARKATADTAGRWRVPAPKGTHCGFEFPFTISEHDIGGIIQFIHEFFGSHADRTVGEFAADRVEVFREPKHGMPGLRAVVWLQPFDQGISQDFTITAKPSAIPEVCEVRIDMERLSGPPAAWRRSYTVFLEILRAQFLLWRTLDDDSREHYLVMAERWEER